MKISVFPTTKAPNVKTLNMSWEEFKDWLYKLPVTNKADSQLVKLATFNGVRTEKGSLRHDDAIVSIEGVECDYDKGVLSIDDAGEKLRQAGIKCVLVPTHQYTEEAPRWRIFAPTSKVLAPALRKELVGRINGVLGGVLAGESFTLSQTYFVGAFGPDYFILEVDGDYIDRLTHLPAVLPGSKEAIATGGKRIDGTIEELLVGEDLHHTTLKYVNKRVAAGWADDDILAVFKGLRSELIEVRGHDRINTLLGGEVQNMIRTARLKEFDAFVPEEELSEEQKARRREAQREQARKLGLDEEILATELFTLDGMLGRFVLITSGSFVGDLKHPRRQLSLKDFNNHTAASLIESQKGEGKITKTKASASWLCSPKRMTVQAITFSAGEPQITRDCDGLLCLNTWNGWHWPEVPAGEVAERGPGLFIDHVKMLFENRSSNFLDWLAHMIQKPEELPHTAWLHISSHQGTGRNWMAGVLARVTRGYCAASIDLIKLLESDFNQALSGKVLGIVDELRESGNGQWSHAQRMKSMITEPIRNINAKFMHPYTEKNSLRWLMFSNHRSAIPIGDGDRRFETVICDARPQDPAYYRELYKALDDPAFIRAVAEYLQARDISAFSPGAAALMTVDKQALINSMASPEIEALKDLYLSYPYRLATAKTLKAACLFSPDADNRALAVRFGHMAEDAGWVMTGRAKVNGDKVSVYCRREDSALFKDLTQAIALAYLSESEGGNAQPNEDVGF